EEAGQRFVLDLSAESEETLLEITGRVVARVLPIPAGGHAHGPPLPRCGSVGADAWACRSPRPARPPPADAAVARSADHYRAGHPPVPKTQIVNNALFARAVPFAYNTSS